MMNDHPIPPLAYALVLIPLSVMVFPTRQNTKTFDQDVKPIVSTYCLPCHLSDSENPSGLSMDSYVLLRKGGENGDPVVPGKPEESLMYLKLQDPPPFGKQMPRNRKSLQEEELRTIQRWIEQGAKEK